MCYKVLYLCSFSSDDEELIGSDKLDAGKEELEDLHKLIKKSAISAVKKFVESHPNVRHAHNKSGRCALTTAIERKNFEIYAFLRSKGFTAGADPDHVKILKRLNIYEKEELKFANRNYFKAFENAHIVDLTLKSRIAFGNDQKDLAKIQNWFEQLDEIPEISVMLRLAANDENFRILFDFNIELYSIDPTQIHDHAFGGIYNSSEVIIAARRGENEVLGSIAHELTHYATNFVFNNNGSPFYQDDIIENINSTK